jgi:serine protease Do
MEFVALVLIVFSSTAWGGSQAETPLAPTIALVQPKIVKIRGAAGFEGLEAYQTGLLISPDGHILTVWSHVLDTDVITTTLSDGRRFEAKLLGADPRLDAAVLKIDANDLPAFNLQEAVEAQAGTRILALSNLFGVATGNEAASVQRGTIAVCTHLEARRGVFETPYRGPVYVLDVVTSNPGAAGGALVTRDGRLLGMLGKELRSSLNYTWLNYAMPIAELRKSVDEIRAGKFVARQEDPAAKRPAHSLDLPALGIVLVPDVVSRTPPYIDSVSPGSPAANAGLRPDDLVMLLDNRLIQSCKSLATDLGFVDRADRVKLTVLRDRDVLEFNLQVESP